MKRTVFLFAAVIFIAFALVSCAENNPGEKITPGEDTAVNDGENGGSPGEETPDGGGADLDALYADDLPEQDFGGEAFRILARDEPWLYVIYDSQEESGELINDAVYGRNRKIEERFGVRITQDITDDLSGLLSRNVRSGEDAYELYLPVDRDALNFGADGTVYKIADIPNIDITKPYWNQSLNDSLTIGGDLYFAYGAFNLSVYDYTHVLLFNKQMVADLGLDSPYNLVNGGNWTFDAYAEMAKSAVKDLNGDGIMDDGDVYGLISIDKHVLPCFWIGAGVQSISKSDGDIPQFTLREEERFASVIERIFDMTYDNDSWYRRPLDGRELYFIDGHTLFADSTFKGVGDLRGIESDFGIIPYPKYDAQQDGYYTRVEGGNPGVVPVTSQNIQMIGTIVEVLHSESAKTVIPAYYEVTLKTKHARDEESSEMLDLIFETRIYDLGDTYWSAILRDGIFLDMFSRNDRNLASQLEKVESRINNEINRVINAINNN